MNKKFFIILVFFLINNILANEKINSLEKFIKTKNALNKYLEFLINPENIEIYSSISNFLFENYKEIDNKDILTEIFADLFNNIKKNKELNIELLNFQLQKSKENKKIIKLLSIIKNIYNFKIKNLNNTENDYSEIRNNYFLYGILFDIFLEKKENTEIEKISDKVYDEISSNLKLSHEAALLIKKIINEIFDSEMEKKQIAKEKNIEVQPINKIASSKPLISNNNLKEDTKNIEKINLKLINNNNLNKSNLTSIELIKNLKKNLGMPSLLKNLYPDIISSVNSIIEKIENKTISDDLKDKNTSIKNIENLKKIINDEIKKIETEVNIFESAEKEIIKKNYSDDLSLINDINEIIDNKNNYLIEIKNYLNDLDKILKNINETTIKTTKSVS